MWDGLTIAIILGTFVLAGLVKGVIGMGLPTVALGLLAAAIDLKVAIALMIGPSLVTNVVQAATGGQLLLILRTIWPFLLMAVGFIWVGAIALTSFDLSLLSGILGLLLVIYGTLGLLGWRPTISPERRHHWGIPLGILNGSFTGMTGSFIVPSVMYLQALGLGRDTLVQAMGVVFLVSTASLAIALRGNAFLTNDLAVASAAAVLPALGGMFLGQYLRTRLSEVTFRRVFLISTVIVGLFIAGKAVFVAG